MTDENSKVINKFGEYVKWIATLKDIDNTVWVAPISEGKWSVSEIVSHINNWDNHLSQCVIPSVKKGQGMEFPDFDSFNKSASEYAKSGITQIDLIHEAITSRKALVNKLLQMSNTDLSKPLLSNGVSHCPHTGEPYTLLYIIKEFIEHDNHHIQQITNHLS